MGRILLTHDERAEVTEFVLHCMAPQNLDGLLVLADEVDQLAKVPTDLKNTTRHLELQKYERLTEPDKPTSVSPPQALETIRLDLTHQLLDDPRHKMQKGPRSLFRRKYAEEIIVKLSQASVRPPTPRG